MQQQEKLEFSISQHIDYLTVNITHKRDIGMRLEGEGGMVWMKWERDEGITGINWKGEGEMF